MTTKPEKLFSFREEAPGLFRFETRIRGGWPLNMYAVRLADGSLLLHSPTWMGDGTFESVEALGTPRVLFAPNHFHHLSLDRFRGRYPAAPAVAAGGALPHDGGPACDLGVFTPEERRAHLESSHDLLVRSVASVEELPDGFSFLWPATEENVVAIARWMAREKRCCSFYRFRLELGGEGSATQQVRLSATGPGAVREFLAAGLAELRAMGTNRHSSELPVAR